MSWSSDEKAAQKLQTIISNQEIFKKTVTAGNAIELDTQVKKMKNKSIDAVIEVIKKNSVFLKDLCKFASH